MASLLDCTIVAPLSMVFQGLQIVQKIYLYNVYNKIYNKFISKNLNIDPDHPDTPINTVYAKVI